MHRTNVSRKIFLVLAITIGIVISGCTARDPVIVDQVAPSTDSEATANAGSPARLADIQIELQKVAEGFDQPLYVTGAGDGSGRLFIVEKTGRIWILRDGERSSEPWLDISDLVSTESERGLLGIAFAPEYGQNGTFYINYTDSSGTTQLARLRTTPTVNRVVKDGLMEPLLSIEQPYSNHNGGMLAFGPDGYLYVGTGDGGSGGDPHGNGQRTDTLLGKLLRIDPESEPTSSPDKADSRYRIPDDNPFAQGTAGYPEIWATGLRNPWRFSFDRTTGDLWIGDVGQNTWEEIDFASAQGGLEPGLNFGWSELEATHPYPPDADPPNTRSLTAPVIEYDHSAGSSVTGGYVYRGSQQPELSGIYFYGDFGSGRIWGAHNEEGTLENRELLQSGVQVVSFGEDDEGELYVVDFNGALYRLVAK